MSNWNNPQKSKTVRIAGPVNEPTEPLQLHHFIAIDGLGWARDKTAFGAMTKLIEQSDKLTSFNIYHVPVPETEGYDIEMYVPKVEGTEMVYKAQRNWEVDIK